MSEAELNPYQVGTYAEAVSKGPRKRPTGLLIYCVIILTLASMGLLSNALTGIIFAVSGGKMDYEQQFKMQPNVRVNEEALAKMQSLAPAHGARSVGMIIAGLIVASLLIAGSVAAIYPIRSAGMILTVGCLVAILFLIGAGIAMTFTSLEVLGVMKEFPGNFFYPKGNANAQDAEFAETVQRVSNIVVPILIWVLSALKIIFYISLIAYLRKANVRQYLAETA